MNTLICLHKVCLARNAQNKQNEADQMVGPVNGNSGHRVEVTSDKSNILLF